MPAGHAVRVAEEALGPWLAPHAARPEGRHVMAEGHRPEQARVLDYLRGRAEVLDTARLRARVRAAAAEFEGALAGLGEPDARREVRPGEWTIAQVVDHVAQSTVRGAEELRHLLADRRPPGPPVYEGLASGAAHRVPWTELLTGLREASAALDAVLDLAERQAPARPTATVCTILVEPSAGAQGGGGLFAAELGWKEYALVQRLHFLDHREQVRQLRSRLP
jgi:hypothetical protein